MLRLREPGTVSEVQVALEPRALRADVEISPKHPHWPEDMIEVTVHLFDARGRRVPSPCRQADGTGQRAAGGCYLDTLRQHPAYLHPQARRAGPWVVRVEIADEFGDPAGRDFMEVAGPEQRPDQRALKLR